MFFLILESFAFLMILITMLIALGYYTSELFEEKMKATVKFIKIYIILILLSSLLFIGSSFPMYVTAFVWASNGFLLYFVFHKFPFITNDLGVDFLMGIISTVFSAFFMLFYFLGSDHSLFLKMSYFMFYVLSAPTMIITSLTAVEEVHTVQSEKPDDSSNEKENQTSVQTKSVMKDVFSSLFRKAEEVLPHSGNKSD